RLAPSLYVKKCTDGHIISSEPLENGCADWLEVPAGKAIEIRDRRPLTLQAFGTSHSTHKAQKSPTQDANELQIDGITTTI
ncbi:MAG: hypothetical protein HOL42_06205, partial [Rhodobacteraceae bacterium]|nr:hypothetical protein [Paracoccaceae bacterium]